MNFVTVLRRAFAANPHVVPVGEGEVAALQARGVQQPVLRTYLAWRRSLLLFVVCSTLLSAGVATYRELTEDEGRVDVLETIGKHLHLEALSDFPAALNEEEVDEESEEEEEVEEAEIDEEPETAFGQFTDVVQLLALYALPLAAVAGAVLWTRFQITFRIMLAAFAFSFLVPLVLAFCPWSWWGYVEQTYSPQTQPLQYFEQAAEGLLEGTTYLVTLLPIVLSLVPGVQRACIRVKLLLPQSLLPGWFLVAASPFYALFLLVIFVAFNQFHTDQLMVAGMLLFLAAPLAYAIRSDLFTKPLASAEDYRRIRGVQRAVGLVTAVAGVLLVAYLASGEVLGVRLLGYDYKTSFVVPLDLVEFLLETLSRSMFITVLGADIFMRMNLSAWKSMQTFIGTAEAANYDLVMAEFERIS